MSLFAPNRTVQKLVAGCNPPAYTRGQRARRLATSKIGFSSPKLKEGAMMRRVAVCLFVAVSMLASAAAADSPDAWRNATALVNEALSDAQSGGVIALGTHASNLEGALARGRQVGFQAVDGDTTYVLTDGTAETIAVLSAVGEANPGGSVSALGNPYPTIALMLGSYYVEIGQPEDAIRVLDEGLAMLDVSGLGLKLSEHRPGLLSERGIAMTSLDRFEDALASYDEGLESEGLSPLVRALLLRGRGFSLIELGRLDEAEQAYLDSVALDPGNPTAENELGYIARLKSGGEPVAPNVVPLAGAGGQSPQR